MLTRICLISLYKVLIHTNLLAQLVASMSGVVLGGVVEVVGSNLARGKIFTASIGSVDSLYPSVYIYIYIYIYTMNIREYLFFCISTIRNTFSIKQFGSRSGPMCVGPCLRETSSLISIQNCFG